MKRLVPVFALALLFVLSADVDAQLFGRRCVGGSCRTKASVRVRANYQAAGCATAGYAAGVYAAQPSVRVAYRYSGPASGLTADGAAGFLAELNAIRASHGLPALTWDQNLANAAATNTAAHAAGSSGGGMQCWAGVSNFAVALQMWMASAAHRAILLSHGYACGISTCPSGVTINVR